MNDIKIIELNPSNIMYEIPVSYIPEQTEEIVFEEESEPFSFIDTAILPFLREGLYMFLDYVFTLPESHR